MRARHRARGFTLLELMAVLLLAGVLAAVALPRLLERSAFAARATRDDVAAALRTAQEAAIAMRRNVCVVVGATRLHVVAATAAGAAVRCELALARPATGQAYGATDYADGAGVDTPLDIAFDALGRPHAASVAFDGAGQPVVTPGALLAAPATLTVHGHDPALTVEAETGLVH